MLTITPRYRRRAAIADTSKALALAGVAEHSSEAAWFASGSERPQGFRSLLSVDVDAVIFDLDGTLFDHVAAVHDGVAGWLARLGQAVTDGLIERWLEAEERFFAAWNRGELDWQGQRRARVREMLGHLDLEAGYDAALDRSFEIYLENYERAWRAFDDAVPALQALAAAGLRTAVLTNGADTQQRAKLAACDLEELAGPLFSSDTIGAAKPDPRAFLYVCDALRLSPQRVLHVGDRYDLDVLGAEHAGLLAIHLNRTDPELPRNAGRITSLRDLPGRLGIPTSLIDQSPAASTEPTPLNVAEEASAEARSSGENRASRGRTGGRAVRLKRQAERSGQ